MTTTHVILLAFAISLDSLALTIVEGAMFPKIRQKEVLKLGLFIGGWQTLAFYAGNRLMLWASQVRIITPLPNSSFFHPVFSFILFITLGLLMLKRGLDRENILESRQNSIEFRRMVAIAIFTSIDSFVTGLGLYFAGTEVTTELTLLFLISGLSVIAGIYIGYWFGSEQRLKAYKMSSIIFLVAATNVLVKM